MNLLKMSLGYGMIFFFLIGTLLGEFYTIYVLEIINTDRIVYSIFNGFLALLFVYFGSKSKT